MDKVTQLDTNISNYKFNLKDCDLSIKFVDSLKNSYAKFDDERISLKKDTFVSKKGNSEVNNKLKLELKKRTVKGFIIQIDNGSVMIEDAELYQNIIDSNNGDVTIRDTECISTFVKTGVGNINIYNSIFDTCALNSEKGNIVLRNNISNDFISAYSEEGQIFYDNCDSKNHTMDLQSIKGRVIIK